MSSVSKKSQKAFLGALRIKLLYFEELHRLSHVIFFLVCVIGIQCLTEAFVGSVDLHRKAVSSMGFVKSVYLTSFSFGRDTRESLIRLQDPIEKPILNSQIPSSA